MLDYLLDAMNEISDEHIAEAVNFEAKAKKINLKKIIPMAACLVFVVAALLTGSGVFGNKPEPSSDPTFNSEPPTMVPTQAPVQNSTTVAPTQCPTQKPWEEMTYGERYRTISIKGVFYVYATESVPAGRIGENLIIENAVSPFVEIYEIKGMTNDLFVAVKFSEDEKGEYFLYLRSDYKPDTLGDLLDAIGIDNLNFIGNSAIYQDVGYNYDGKGWSDDHIEIVYNIDAKGHKELSSLLWKNRNAVCLDDYSIRDLSKVTVRTELLGQSTIFSIMEGGILKSKTYLHIYISATFNGNMYYCFELEDNAIKDYIAFLGEEAEIIREDRYSPEQLTSTTTPTTVGTTLPPTNESYSQVENALAAAETLADVIDAFSIAKADYGISGDMSVDMFAHLEEKGKEDVIYSIAADTKQQLVDFMYDNKNSKAESRSCQADIRLVFSAYFIGNTGRITLGSDGYLYLTCGSITKAFYVGEDAYRDFKENLICAVWTTENPVTFG